MGKETKKEAELNKAIRQAILSSGDMSGSLRKLINVQEEDQVDRTLLSTEALFAEKDSKFAPGNHYAPVLFMIQKVQAIAFNSWLLVVHRTENPQNYLTREYRYTEKKAEKTSTLSDFLQACLNSPDFSEEKSTQLRLMKQGLDRLKKDLGINSQYNAYGRAIVAETGRRPEKNPKKTSPLLSRWSPKSGRRTPGANSASRGRSSAPARSAVTTVSKEDRKQHDAIREALQYSQQDAGLALSHLIDRHPGDQDFRKTLLAACFPEDIRSPLGKKECDPFPKTGKSEIPLPILFFTVRKGLLESFKRLCQLIQEEASDSGSFIRRNDFMWKCTHYNGQSLEDYILSDGDARVNEAMQTKLASLKETLKSHGVSLESDEAASMGPPPRLTNKSNGSGPGLFRRTFSRKPNDRFSEERLRKAILNYQEGSSPEKKAGDLLNFTHKTIAESLKQFRIDNDEGRTALHFALEKEKFDAARQIIYAIAENSAQLKTMLSTEYMGMIPSTYLGSIAAKKSRSASDAGKISALSKEIQKLYQRLLGEEKKPEKMATRSQAPRRSTAEKGPAKIRDQQGQGSSKLAMRNPDSAATGPSKNNAVTTEEMTDGHPTEGAWGAWPTNGASRT